MVNCNADVGCRYEFSNCLFEAYTDKVTTCYCTFPFHQIKKITTTTTTTTITTTTTTSSRCKPSASATRSTGPPRLRTTCARLSKCPLSKCPALYCLHCIVFDNVFKGEKLACVKNLVEQIGEFKDVNIALRELHSYTL